MAHPIDRSPTSGTATATDKADKADRADRADNADKADKADTTDKGLPALVSELWDLVLRYAKQETVDPLKALGRYLAAGVAGAVALGIGLVLLALALLRALQEETAPHLSRNWSWAPYLIVVLVAGLIVAVLARGIGAERRKVERERSRLRQESQGRR